MRFSLFCVFLLTLLCGGAEAQFMMEHDGQGKALRGLHELRTKPVRRSFQSDQEALGVMRTILRASNVPGLEDRILIRATPDVGSAEASKDESGQIFIFYNTSFMQELKQNSGKYWSLVFVLAHEVGHIIAGHLEFQGQDHRAELEADRYAGGILARMGASWEDTLAVTVALPLSETATHPRRSERSEVIALGWRDGSSPPSTIAPELNAARPGASVPPSPPVATAPGSGAALTKAQSLNLPDLPLVKQSGSGEHPAKASPPSRGEATANAPRAQKPPEPKREPPVKHGDGKGQEPRQARVSGLQSCRTYKKWNLGDECEKNGRVCTVYNIVNYRTQLACK